MFTQSWSTVSCPLCGALPGVRCRSKYGVIVHGARIEVSPVVPNKAARCNPKVKKIKKKTIPIGKHRGIHEEGWVSGNCKAGRHSTCFSLSCSCEHHKEE